MNLSINKFNVVFILKSEKFSSGLPKRRFQLFWLYRSKKVRGFVDGKFIQASCGVRFLLKREAGVVSCQESFDNFCKKILPKHVGM